MHAFFVWLKVASCLERIGIDNIVCELLHKTNNFTVILFDLLRRLSEQQQTLIVMMLWSLWTIHNTKLWESTDTSPTFTVTCSRDTLHEWSYIQRVKTSERNFDHTFEWSKPPIGIIPFSHITSNVFFFRKSLHYWRIFCHLSINDFRQYWGFISVSNVKNSLLW